MHPLARTRYLLVLLLTVALTLAMEQAHAAYTLTLSQVGANVVVTGYGQLNTTALTMYQFPASTRAILNPINGGVGNGPTATTSVTLYFGGITGPANFGSGGSFAATIGSGDITGLSRSSNDIAVPVGYVSNSFLANTSTYANATFASLGFNPGTYTYTWGVGTANADSFVITSIVPEPSTWAMLAAGVGLLGAGVLRRRCV